MRARAGWLAIALIALLPLLRGLAPASSASPNAASLALIVLDTVRADRLSLCGYARPTSPTLERLRDEGASFSCGGVVPGSWTLPVHASLFTGLDVEAHAADFARSPHGGASAACLDVLCKDADPGVEVAELFGSIAARPLQPEAETLAELFRRRGYQTVLVSGNPVVSAVTGLAQGFDHVVSPRRFAELEGVRLVGALQGVLDDLDRSGPPLFLTVNIAEAHQPYQAVPPGVAWLPPREAIHYFLPESDPWTRFVSGRMTAAERDAFRAHVGDVYDWGVYLADQTLGRVLATLERDGWFRNGFRVVVTSDHGELLGEHGLLDHGGYLWEPIARVPILVRDSTQAPPSLPALLTATSVYQLVRDGRLPEPAPRVAATAQPNHRWQHRTHGRVGGTEPSAAVWMGSEKLHWMEGRILRFHLGRDPGERQPEAPLDHPGLTQLTSLMAGARRLSRLEASLDPALVERLRAAGYVE